MNWIVSVELWGVLRKTLFCAVVSRGTNMAQLSSENAIFYTRFNDMHRKSAYLYIGQKRTDRPLRINALRLYIGPPYAVKR